MFEHVVLFKLKPDLTPQAVQKLRDALNGLRGIVPGILQFQLTDNLSQRSQGHTLVLFSRFVTSQAHDAYQAHPKHVEALEKVMALTIRDGVYKQGVPLVIGKIQGRDLELLVRPEVTRTATR